MYTLLDIYGNRIINNILCNYKERVGGSLTKKMFGETADNSRWEAHIFEGNPNFNAVLNQIGEMVSKNHTMNIYTKTAAWIYDGTIDFFLDTVNKDVNFWGSSLNENHPDAVRSGKKKIRIDCRDVASIINRYSVTDFVVVKIDIEGAEYDLLIDFIKKDVFKIIDYIAVEFHPSVTKYKTGQDVLMEIIKNSGSDFAKWAR